MIAIVFWITYLMIGFGLFTMVYGWYPEGIRDEPMHVRAAMILLWPPCLIIVLHSFIKTIFKHWREGGFK